MKKILKNSEEDQTREVRECITENSSIEFEGTAYTHGMLPEDLEKEYFNPAGSSYGKIGDIGKGKIIPIHNRKDLKIKGGSFINNAHPFTDETRPTRRHHNVSELSFLDIADSKNISITDLSFTGPHEFVRDKTGYPLFRSSLEFEHGIDVRNSENVFLKNLNFKNVPGDFVYLRNGGGKKNKNITIIDCEIDFNGRQGVAWGDGENIYIDNLKVKLSGRGGVDFEPPKQGYVAKNVIVKNSYFNTWLLPVPMGGLGIVENIFIENNEWESTSMNTFILADRVNSFRRNIIFRGNNRLSGYGSETALYVLRGAENVLIENEYALLKEVRGQVVAEVNNCENVIIRNNDFVNGKYIVLIDTPIEEMKVLGNKQDLIFRVYEFDMPFKEAPNLKDFAQYGRDDWSMWSKAMQEHDEYMKERLSRGVSKEIPVIDYEGEINVPKDPDFIPYMGAEEPPVVEPEPEEPEEPIDPPKEEPTPEVPEEKPIYKKTWFISAAIAVILILTALIIT